MAKIVDPDQLNDGTEITINTGTKTIQLSVAGNLDDTAPGKSSGVSVQAVYSKLKELWKNSGNNYHKYRFPMLAIFEAKFEMINGWDWADAQTRQLLRDGGWKETSGDEYAAILSLGDMDDSASDQAYYQQVAGLDGTTTNFDKTGELNEGILYLDFGTFDYSDFLKVFLREQGKTFDEGNLLIDQDLSALTYQAYRLPLTNGTDLNISATDVDITTNSPYTGMTVDYLKGAGFTTAAATTYSVGDVVQDGNGRWAFCTTGGTVTTPGGSYSSFGGTSAWEAYAGEIQIGSNYYAFNKIIDGNGGSATQIYEWAQYQLRQASNINDNTLGSPNQNGYGTVNGNVAPLLCYFVGDQLYTYGGVGITNFNVNSTNNIKLSDITVDGGGVDTEGVAVTTTVRPFPFVAAGTLIFSSNLVSEPDADTYYYMYFSNAGGNQFDTANAIVVNDNTATPISGQITGATIPFSFDYTNNNQGGRTPNTDADVVVVAQGLNGATWVEAAGTITQATGIEIRVNAADERNYLNPV